MNQGNSGFEQYEILSYCGFVFVKTENKQKT